MLIGIGCDVIEIARVQRAVERQSFVERVFAPEEIAYCESRGKQAAASYAARFAAKEAVLKALGTGLRGVELKEIIITNNELGRPCVQLLGYHAELAEKLGVQNIAISLSHSREMALAYVVMEG